MTDRINWKLIAHIIKSPLSETINLIQEATPKRECALGSIKCDKKINWEWNLLIRSYKSQRADLFAHMLEVADEEFSIRIQ